MSDAPGWEAGNAAMLEFGKLIEAVARALAAEAGRLDDAKGSKLSRDNPIADLDYR